MKASKASKRPTRVGKSQPPQGSSPHQKIPRWRVFLPWLVVPAVAIATYLTALPNGFVSDAVNLIKANQAIMAAREWLPWFSRTYTWGSTMVDPTLYRPLTVLSYVVTARIGGANPMLFMAGNILLHAAVSLLVLALGRRLVGPVAGLMGGLLFAVHPIHTEVVAWIAGRPDLLTTLFSVASALSFLRATEAGATRPALFAGGTVVSYFAALLSKEHAVVLPAWFGLAWLIERRRRSVRWTIAIVAGSAVALAAFLALRAPVVAPLYEQGIRGPHLGSPWVPWRWLTALAIAGHYAKLFLWPRFLTFDNWLYGMVSVQSARGFGIQEMWGAMVIAGLLAAIVWSARKVPGLAQALTFTAITYIIVSSVPPSPLLFVAERVMYLPSVGVALGAGWLLAELGRRAMGLRQSGQAVGIEVGAPANGPIRSGALTIARAGWRGWVAVGIGVTLLTALSVRTAARNFDWRTSESISRASIAVNPESPQALGGLGNVAFDRKDYAQAQALLERSLEINPTNWPTYVLLFGVYTRTGQMEKAFELFSRGIEAMPDRPEPYHHLGGLLWRMGRLEEAEARVREAIAREPRFFPAYLALGGLLLDKGRPAEAMEAFQSASRLKPQNPMAWMGLARAAQAEGRIDDAQRYAAKARSAAHQRPEEAEGLPAHADPRFAQ